MPFQSYCSMPFQSPGSIPDWIELIPAGEFQGRDGRRFINDEPYRVVAAFQANLASLPVDIEHASELKAKLGEPAPAQGWIEDLDVRGGAVWGRIEWTVSGHAVLANRQYRYYSPVFCHRTDSNQVLALKSAGLTNQPNLFVPALNQREDKDNTIAAHKPSFIVPPGYTVDANRAELHEKAIVYQQQHQCSYFDAAVAVGA
jgi:hypothetical protein